MSFTIKGVKFEVLSKEELATLLNVKTNKRMARDIKRRNKAVLQHINNPKTVCNNGIWGLGCPHCLEAQSLCIRCEWQRNMGSYKAEVCLEAEFGGYSHTDVGSYIQLSSTAIFWTGHKLELQRKYDIEYVNELIKGCTAFLAGHIEWADAILKGITAEDVERSICREKKKKAKKKS